MKTEKMSFQHYHPYTPVQLPDRTWPDKTITKAPIWCSIDLRDGNQALPSPMNIAEKLEMFKMLVKIGFKEIEVGFPSAAQVEFDFVRTIIECGYIPENVTIQVLTQAREHLIRRTFESIKGAKNAIVHVYNSTSKRQRDVVFCKDKAGIKQIAADAAILMSELRGRTPESNIRFEYTPESFHGTELEYALEICRTVIDIWRPSADDRAIINLPSTVETCTPNIFADRIEWFLRNIDDRRSIIMSVHTHNDRGTAVAAAELAVMAGAERVEGALFGNGERTGNMDIMNMAMNLFSQGVDSKLDFSNIDEVCGVYSKCTHMPIHPRHPYAGELVYTAFSGSHQDAIHKALKVQQQSNDSLWDVPYLPVDPGHVGRSYKAIIRINSQSGKGGISYVMETDWGLNIPKIMQPDFSGVIQKETEAMGRELSSREIYDCFQQEYLSFNGQYALGSCSVRIGDVNGPNTTNVKAMLSVGMETIDVDGEGNGPIDAFVNGLGVAIQKDIEIVMYEEHALYSGADTDAIAYIGIRSGGELAFGAGIDANISTASIKAVLCAVNRVAKV
jgi:2-isopropylmalate synthase